MEGEPRFRSRDEEVVIYPWARIVNSERIEIGRGTRIDDFTFINGGQGIKIGRYVHIASFTSIIGGGELEIGDYVSLACGARIVTGTHVPTGGKRMTASLPIEEQSVMRGKVVIGKDAFVGTNVVVHPDVVIGEGAVIGSNSLVLEDVEPWSVNVGSPCRKIGMREKVTIQDH